MDIIDSRTSWTSSNKDDHKALAQETLLFALLDSWLGGASEQIMRINRGKRILNASLKKTDHANWLHKNRVRAYHQKILFLDIHFFLIAAANISKVLESLKKLKSREPEFVSVLKKYNPELSRLRHMFRNLLEHVTEESLNGQTKKKKPLKNPGDFGNLSGDDYSLFGEKFNLPATFKLIESLSEDLSQWSSDEVKKIYKIKT